jgi:hypothetical protein
VTRNEKAARREAAERKGVVLMSDRENYSASNDEEEDARELFCEHLAANIGGRFRSEEEIDKTFALRERMAE